MNDNLKEGLAGCDRAFAAADDDWREQAINALYETCQELAVLTSDNVWDRLDARGIPRPRAGAAMGGVMKYGAKQGWCTTGLGYTRTRQEGCHSVVAVWSSKLYQPTEAAA